MELRLLLLAMRLLDPRKWRWRLAQLVGGSAFMGWLWFKSVNDSELVRARRDLSRAERNAGIRARRQAREAAAYEL